MRFDELQIIAPILKALKEKNYTEPTSIQQIAIPLILQGNDILGSAQTGTGKTAAFAIPIIQQIDKILFQENCKPKIKALIITPTRELAIQIDENITKYGKYTRVKNTVIFGGVKQHQQVAELKSGVDILTATPGRLLDLIGQGFVNLDSIKIFVLDEADRMLDMGFIHDIKKLIELLPPKKQSLFFSATIPKTIIDLSRKILQNPKKVELNPASSTAETIQQELYYTNKSSKKELLRHILSVRNIQNALLFVRTKHGADRIAQDLKKHKINSAAIHGDKAQNHRQKVLSQFKNGQVRVLVATDIAARGIDIDKLKYVINFDIPDVAETYVHRIGRSGRAGEVGIAISMCEPEENSYVKEIEKLTKQKLGVVKNNPFPQTDKPMNLQERKDFNKVKQLKKQEFFASRNKSMQK